MRLIHTSLFFKIFKMWCRLLKFSENRQNFFLLDNCIRIGCDKFPLLQTEYVSSAVNVSTDSLTISDISISDIRCSNFSRSDEVRDKSAVVQISAVFWTL